MIDWLIQEIQIRLNSHNGPIEVYLCPDNSPDDDVGPQEGVLTPPMTQPLTTMDVDNLFDVLSSEIRNTAGRASRRSMLM